MKYLVYVLILLYTSPVFAYDSGSAFMGAHGITDDPAAEQESPVAEQDSPVVEQEPEFKIDERLYAESIGSNYGYYGGGYYGEERYASQIEYYTITSDSGQFGVNTGFIVVNDQLIPFSSSFPFIASFPIFSSGSVFRGGVGVNIGSFTFFRGGFGRGGFGHGGFGFSHFGHRHR